MGQEGSHIRLGLVRSLVTVIVVTIGQLLYGVWVTKACEPPKAASWAEFAMPEIPLEGAHMRLGPVRSLVTKIEVTIGQLLYGVWVAKACEPPKAASWAEFTMPEIPL
jgi:hypothetical protein